MEESNRVFVDSNFFVALFHPADALHERAAAFLRQLQKAPMLFATATSVFGEVTTILSQRQGRNIAVEVGNHLLSDPRIQMIVIDDKLHTRAWEIFKKMSHKDISFVDCTVVAAMEAEGIRHLLTFDATDFKRLQKLYPFSFLTFNNKTRG